MAKIMNRMENETRKRNHTIESGSIIPEATFKAIAKNPQKNEVIEAKRIPFILGSLIDMKDVIQSINFLFQRVVY